MPPAWPELTCRTSLQVNFACARVGHLSGFKAVHALKCVAMSARQLVRCCLQAERTTLTLEDGSKLYNMHTHELYWERRHDTKCLMAWGDDAIVLAFRGTASFANARADLQVTQHCTPSVGPQASLVPPGCQPVQCCSPGVACCTDPVPVRGQWPPLPAQSSSDLSVPCGVLPVCRPKMSWPAAWTISVAGMHATCCHKMTMSIGGQCLVGCRPGTCPGQPVSGPCKTQLPTQTSL